LFIERPTDEARSAIALQRVRVWAITRLTGTGYALFVTAWRPGQPAVRVADPPGSNAATLYDTGPWTDNPKSLAVTLHCDGVFVPPPYSCNLHDEMPLEIQGAEVTLSEDVVPVASVLGGTMLAAGTVGGVRSVRYAATDRESGVERIEVALGDAVVAARGPTAGCTYADFTACPVTVEDEIAVDTGQVANGRYPMSMRVYDAAGNRQVIQLPAVEVRNVVPAQGSPTSAGAGEKAQITARLVGSTRSTMTVPYGRRVIIRGHLATASKQALARARVDVLERPFRTGAREVAASSTVTRTDGTFSVPLARYGPSRTVRLTYGDGRLERAASRPLKLRVRAASSFRATLRGTLVRFGGRVRTLPLPAAGKRIVLQGRAPGFAWSSFAALRTDRRGRFAGRYRLPVRRAGVKLQVRVVVPAERAYPYASYSGRPVVLRVR